VRHYGRDWDGGTFGIGMHAGRAEFRHGDISGRPVDASTEGDTARSERITRLQDRRLADGERTVPPAEPAAALAEWFARHPDQRLGKFGVALAERGGEMVPRMILDTPDHPADFSEFYRNRQAAMVTPVIAPGR
jgi:hypothetical protein